MSNKRWTIKEMEELSDLAFAKTILYERASSLNPNAPLAQKLYSAIATLSELELAQPHPDKENEGPFKTVEEVFEALDWTYTYDKETGAVELEKASPAGEDFIFAIDGKNIPREVREYAADFDVDEHIELWIASRGERGVPKTARELVEDAEAIQAMLDELSDALDKVPRNCDLGIFNCETCVVRNCCDWRTDQEEAEDDE